MHIYNILRFFQNLSSPTGLKTAAEISSLYGDSSGIRGDADVRVITKNEGNVIGENDGMDLSLLFCSSSGQWLDRR